MGREALARHRILRKSLDARSHADLHFVYAAEVELPGDEADLLRRGLGRDIEPFQDEAFDWPVPGSAPSHSNIGRSSSAPGRRAGRRLLSGRAAIGRWCWSAAAP